MPRPANLSAAGNSAYPRCNPNERGATVILFSFLLVSVLAPLIGFAIDGSICYWMKAKLSSSVDAAALAAARSLSLASSSSQLQAQGAAVGAQYFSANLQPGTMGSSLVNFNGQTSPVITVTETTAQVSGGQMAQVINVSVSASVSVPLYFLRLLGYQAATLSDTGQSTRRNTNLIMVLDRSYSMQQAGVCSQVASNAQQFIDNYFVEGRDTVALVTFQSTANVDFSYNTTFKNSINNLLGQMVCTGYTTTAEALYKAYQQIQAINQQSALNVIVMLTDGQPDSIVANFPIKTYADTRYDPFNTSTYMNTPPSGCLPTVTLSGVLTDALGAPDATGYTAGVFPDTATAISYSSPYIVPTSTISAQNCAFTNASNYPTYTADVRLDVAYLPATDIFGNSFTAYKPLQTYPSGSPYAGKIFVDTPVTVMNAATNAAYNMAATIRTSPYKVVIYTIGLGGTQYQQIDTDFLMRVANDPTLPSSEFRSGQPVGSYHYATPSNLATVFAQIASQMLHLSQ